MSANIVGLIDLEGLKDFEIFEILMNLDKFKLDNGVKIDIKAKIMIIVKNSVNIGD